MKLLSLLLLLLFSCGEVSNEGKHGQIFLKNYSTSLGGEVTEILIEDKKLYYCEDIPVAGSRKLVYKLLKENELKLINQYFDNLNIINLESEYIDDRFSANYEYEIHIENGISCKNIFIFQNEICLELKDMTLSIDSLVYTGYELDTVHPILTGIEDFSIENKIITDAVQLHSNESFKVWKTLMCFEGDIEMLATSNNSVKFDYYYTGSYGLNYKGKVIKTIGITSENVFLVYENGNILKLSIIISQCCSEISSHTTK